MDYPLRTHNSHTTHTFIYSTIIAKGRVGSGLASYEHTHTIVWMSLCVVCVCLGVDGGAKVLCSSAAISTFLKCSLVICSLPAV